MTKRKTRLPSDLKTNVRRILRANEPLFDFFRFMVNNGNDLNHRKDKNITSLFINVNSWVKRTKEYNTALANKGSSRVEYLVEKYSSWNVYMDHVSKLYKSRPSPKESDECMLSLSENPIKLRGLSYKCVTLEDCNDIVVNGTMYGYALTHRVLYLLAARYGRNCHTFSPQVDDALIDDLCSTIYEEAQYIALNGYKHADLLMEQICLCTLAGHASFLQRRWLSSLLRLQTSHGCFRQNLKPSASVEALATKPWRISKKDTQLIMGKRCNGHVTAVAVATLGAAVRYIVETYY
ncbi:UPF0764 protein C16orf89 homolog [Choristoneura fumiferana]|uniref:UPF0764 protein C16orf89 homolog n=1 Tax=Choristoneura fumiferana TaxID=7141 RepID=UPI003D15BAF0